MNKPNKQERVEIVNKILRKIASKSHQDFYYKDADRYAEMKIKNGRIYFTDDYTGKDVYAYSHAYGSKRGKFSHGGTMWGLINDFREFIQTGKYTNGNHGYGGLYCTHWGYEEEDMKDIRAFARELGYLR
jgi:hypothetical protein